MVFKLCTLKRANYLFHYSSGKVNVTDSKAACQAAARPDVDPDYQNYCVECLEEYMDTVVQVTYVLPIQPVNNTTQNADQNTVSAEELRSALGAPPPDINAAAKKLAVSPDALKQALRGVGK